MKIITRIGWIFASISILLALPFAASAYEVNVLRDDGAQYANIESGKYEVAIEKLEEMLKYKTKYRDVKLTNLCTAYVLVGNFERATEVCDQAVEAAGTFVATALNSRGVLNALKGDFMAAAADFDSAAGVDTYGMWTHLAHHKAIHMNEEIALRNLTALRTEDRLSLTAEVAE